MKPSTDFITRQDHDMLRNRWMWTARSPFIFQMKNLLKRTTKLEHRVINIENYPEMTERVMPKAKDVSSMDFSYAKSQQKFSTRQRISCVQVYSNRGEQDDYVSSPRNETKYTKH